MGMAEAIRSMLEAGSLCDGCFRSLSDEERNEFVFGISASALDFGDDDEGEDARILRSSPIASTSSTLPRTSPGPTWPTASQCDSVLAPMHPRPRTRSKTAAVWSWQPVIRGSCRDAPTTAWALVVRCRLQPEDHDV